MASVSSLRRPGRLSRREKRSPIPPPGRRQERRGASTARRASRTLPPRRVIRRRKQRSGPNPAIRAMRCPRQPPRSRPSTAAITPTQMEPLNAVAAASPTGDSAEIWCGTQSQTTAQEASAKALGIAREKVKVNYLLMGGGFGRRGPRDADFVVDAVLLAKD